MKNVVMSSLFAAVIVTAQSGNAFAATASVLASKTCPAAQPLSNMKQTFGSEFTKATSLDTTQWRAVAGLHGGVDQELEAYDPSEVSIVPTAGLRISTEPKLALQHPYSSGQVATRGLFSQTYGHFEAMIKMPQANGIWPAFWMLPENGTWPPEIDIVEYIYAVNGVLPGTNATTPTPWIASNPAMTLHWGSNNSQTSPGWNSSIQQPYAYKDWNTKPALAGWSSAYTGYHTYAVDWRPGSVNFLIDGLPAFCAIDTAATGKRVPDGPMYMILNQAVAAGTALSPAWAGYIAAGQSFPIAMDVAYVRAFSFNDIPQQDPLPIDIKNITLSKAGSPEAATITAKAGDSVTITAKIGVGSQDLGFSSGTYVTVKPQDTKNYFGLGSNVATLPISSLKLSKNSSYTVSTTYKIPTNLSAGIYSVGLQTGYTASIVNGDGNNAQKSITNQQLALIYISK